MNNEPLQSQETLETRQDELPKFYSKKVILSFCAFFSVFFGGVLMMRNLSRAGNKRGQAVVFLFSFLYMILVFLSISYFKLNPNYTFPFNIAGAAILNEYFWSKYLDDIAYEKKSWYKPAIISLGIALLMFMLVTSSLG